MIQDLPTAYDAKAVEPRIHERWQQADCFHAEPDPAPSDPDADPPGPPYAIVIPPPNVTGALHMGHALTNSPQDICTRYHRMKGDNAVWLPGTDHAGIATQAVVERLLLEKEGKTRHDLGREALVQRIWDWKEKYGNRILEQLRRLGFSCDWSRTRFTMDENCTRAVREAFFRLFKDGLVYRGKRLVNWDCYLQTAVADDEIEQVEQKSKFYHFRYPIAGAQGGDLPHVVIATTRPETLLGDTAVAVHPEPRRELEHRERQLLEQLETATDKDRKELEERLARLRRRREEMLGLLEQLAALAKAGARLDLPLVGRDIPLICDHHADPEKGTGAVKITPAHDANDYLVGQRQDLPMINILHPDGRINDAGQGTFRGERFSYTGLDRFEARKRVVADLERLGLVEKIEEIANALPYSDRSKTPIEPYLSEQWFVCMGDEPPAGTRTPAAAPCGHTHAPGAPQQGRRGLAQRAIDAVIHGKVKFFPERYEKTYLSWLDEKRDWCISRQLWWGHRIPVWTLRFKTHSRMGDPTSGMWAVEAPVDSREETDAETRNRAVKGSAARAELLILRLIHAANLLDDVHVRAASDDWTVVHICARSAQADALFEQLSQHWAQWSMRDISEAQLKRETRLDERVAECARHVAETYEVLERDPDVLDTWFSSALWPLSTLGWPDDTADLARWYPTSVLITSRDIITLWVARMVLFGLYLRDDVPFRHVHIVAKLLDGDGVTMSKSKGNGIDPLDLIERFGTDGLRYTLADLMTGTQDIRLPVQIICPHCQHLFANPSSKKEVVDCPACKQKLTRPMGIATGSAEAPLASVTSDKFEIGRNFVNKLWNAGRFVLMNLATGGPRGATLHVPTADELAHEPGSVLGTAPEAELAALRAMEGGPDGPELPIEDRWILSRLQRAIQAVSDGLERYEFAAAVDAFRSFFWGDFCDWYLELVKPRLAESAERPAAGADPRDVLEDVFDTSLRLLHPICPFITEELFGLLNEVREGPAPQDQMLCTEDWPTVDADAVDPAAEEQVGLAIALTKAVREVRASQNIPPARKLDVVLAAGAERLSPDLAASLPAFIARMGPAGAVTLDPSAAKPADAAVTVSSGITIYVLGAVDPQAERARLEKQRAELDKRIGSLKSRLGNEAYVAKAPAKLIEETRGQLAAAEAELARVTASLAGL